MLEVPRTPFNKTISARRNFAYGSVSLTKVKKVKDEYGCTVNDVANGNLRWGAAALARRP